VIAPAGLLGYNRDMKKRAFIITLLILALLPAISCGGSQTVARGVMQASRYENASLRIAFNLPEGWRFYTDAELAEENPNTALPNPGELYEKAAMIPEGGSVIDMSAVHEASGNNTQLSIINMKDVDSCIASVSESLASAGFSLGSVSTASIAGSDWQCVEAEYGSYAKPIVRKYYLKESNGYVVCISTTTGVVEIDVRSAYVVLPENAM